MSTPTWVNLPPLPYGLAGMFAGKSKDRVICMGGTNFPDKLPWEGGKKKWYQSVFLLDDNKWVKLKEKLSTTLAYGVSVSYKDKIIVVGGSINADEHTKNVFSISWDGVKLNQDQYPDLPHPLANMAGALVNNLIVIIGGMDNPQGLPLKKCYLFDLENPQSNWIESPEFPGEERVFPVCTSFDSKLYVFSGENVKSSSTEKRNRCILQDAYCLKLFKKDGRWTGQWNSLADMPKGVSAGANPAPVVNNSIMFWGGVDRITALHSDPTTHPGMPKDILWYYPETDSWTQDYYSITFLSPVTLPTVNFKGCTYYISGEVKPGARTEKILGVMNKG